MGFNSGFKGLIGDEFNSFDPQDIYFIQKRHVLIKRAAVNALLRLPLSYIHVYLKSVLRHNFLILYSCHPDVSKDVRIRGYLLKPKEIG